MPLLTRGSLVRGSGCLPTRGEQGGELLNPFLFKGLFPVCKYRGFKPDTSFHHKLLQYKARMSHLLRVD